MDSKKVLKDNWKGITQGIFTIIVIILIIRALGLSWWQIILFIVGFQITMAVYNRIKNKKPIIIKQLAKGALQVTFLVSMIYLFKKWALLGLLGILVFIAAYKIITRWDTYVWARETVEKAIWGETLREKFKREKEEKNK